MLIAICILQRAHTHWEISRAVETTNTNWINKKKPTQLKTFQQFFSAAPSKRVKLCNKREIRGKTQRIVSIGLKVALN